MAYLPKEVLNVDLRKLKMAKNLAKKHMVYSESDKKLRVKNIIDANKKLNVLLDKLKKNKATTDDLSPVLLDLEEYFDKSDFPTLTLYSGVYAGEILELCFAKHPDVFRKDRYHKKEKNAYKRMFAHSHLAFSTALEDGSAKPNQIVDYLKYIEKFSSSVEPDKKDVSAIKFSFLGDE